MSAAYRMSEPAEDFFARADEQARTMKKYLQSDEAVHADHAQIEQYVLGEGREYQRRLAQAHMELRSARERPVAVTGADRVLRSYRRLGSRPLMLVFGQVQVPRLGYQQEGVDSLHPMDAALNLSPDLYSHGVRKLVAEHVARASYEETVDWLANTTGAPVGKRQVEELAARASQDFEAFYESRAVQQEVTTALLVITVDAKGVVMRRQDLRPETRKAAERSQRKLGTRLTKGEKPNRKRMAEVAAIYSVDPFPRTVSDVVHELRSVRQEPVVRPKPFNKRVWASVRDEAHIVIEQAFVEAKRRDPQQLRTWVVVLDGNKDQIKLVKWTAKKLGVKVTIVLDIIHVLDYLWKASHCFHPAGTPETEQWVQGRLMSLLQGRSAGYLAKGMRRLADQRGLQGAARKAVENCAGYLVNNRELLHYDRALAEGLPIGSGVIEGACRYLVKDRMDRTGARWSLLGAEAVLRLRSLWASGDFDAYWEFHMQREYDRNHRALYADGQVPNPLPVSTSPLRRVK